MTRLRTVVVALVAVAGASIGLLSIGAGSALAARAHGFSLAFGGSAKVPGEAGSLSLAQSPPGILEAPGSGLAVNDTTHDLYVANTGDRRIDEFSASGTFVRAWGWGVATGAPKLEVCTSSCRVGLSGSAPGQFETPSYVAVDNSTSSASKGDVYVGDTGDNLVTKFHAEGQLVGSWGNNGENAKHERTEPNGQLNGSPTELFTGANTQPLAGIIVDPAGDLWVLDRNSRLFEFKDSGAWVKTCTVQLSIGVGGIAVNSSCPEESCSIYIHQGFRRVERITPGCLGGDAVTAGGAESKGLAVDLSNGDVYVDREGSWIEDIPGTCQPSPSGCQPSQAFGEESLAMGPPPPLGGGTGIAVDPGSGAVYVANTATEQIAAFGLTLEAKAGSASGVGATEVTVNGSVNPEGTKLTGCVFEYGTTTEYGASVPCDQSSEEIEEIGHNTALTPVSGKVRGLMGGTVYHYRLHATGKRGNAYSEDAMFQTAVTAVIREVKVVELAASSAVLQAKIDAAGLAAGYHFEYGPCDPVKGCGSSPYPTTVPVPDAPVPGLSEATVSQPIEGLSASATYHFRIVVSDANGVAVGPEVTFLDEPAASFCSSSRPPEDQHLADCRAYEMVTPAVKDGALIGNGVFLTQPTISPDGSLVLAKSIQCLHSPLSCVGIRQTEGEPYAFQRTGGGWETTPLAPPPEAGGTMLTYSAETGDVLDVLAAVPPAREQIYSRTADGVFHAIGPIAETAGVKVGQIAGSPLLATADLGVVLFAQAQLWPSLEGKTVEGKAPHGRTLFEYRGTGLSSPSLVAVTGPTGSGDMIGACGTELGGSGAGHNVLSADTRTVFFTVFPCREGGTGSNAGVEVPAFQVYARIEQAGGASTVHVSAPGPESVCDIACRERKPADAAFQSASADGSRVYFTSTQQLTSSASEDGRPSDSASTGCATTAATATGCNLYEFECPNHCENLSERRLVDVSAGDTSGVGPQVQGAIAISDDGSSVYFVAHGVLAGANVAGERPVPGRPNLYAYRASSGGPGQIAFVATLARSDAALWTASNGLAIANVTPDGRYLLFTSHRSLTADATRSEGPAQVYRYDADSGALLRVSIGREGYHDNGNAAKADAGIVPASRSSIGERGERGDPSMSNDGQFVFFETPTGLTPGALDNRAVIGNPHVLAENVYEWAAGGARTAAGGVSCEKPTGCVSLISDGKDLVEGTNAHGNLSAVQLLGADTTGENVFFWTADPLVPGDTDSQIDLYDARVGGGFPAPPEPASCVSLEQCHPPPSPPPTFGSASSGGFSGLGNAIPGTEQPPRGGGPLPLSLTPAQKLAKALQTCRKLSSRAARQGCEGKAQRRYRSELLVIALKACQKKHGRTRAACERQARARFGAHRVTRRRSRGHQ